ncbi:MAG: hypothetical protein PHH70_05705 [Candidatus Gracilibacteria bacterium]|nr:hypothetical protein [Candidatus Gracilibacteria bacterium]
MKLPDGLKNIENADGKSSGRDSYYPFSYAVSYGREIVPFYSQEYIENKEREEENDFFFENPYSKNRENELERKSDCSCNKSG